MKHWIVKFRNAFRGLRFGIAGQTSFYVHIPATLAVPLVAYLLHCEFWQWCMLGMCIGIVWALELFNSAIESLARGLCSQTNAEVGKALDIASAAVLVGALTASCVGIAIFVCQLFNIMNW